MNATITLDSGRILDVEYTIEPADGDGWNSPKTGEHIDITGAWDVSLAGKPGAGMDAETTDAEDVEILAALWREILVRTEDCR